MSNIFAMAGAKFYIGTTIAASDESDFAADTYVEVGSSESIGDFGDTATNVPFTGLGDQRTQHLKGSFDGGTMALTCARDDSDAGQAAMLAAFLSPLDYNMKILWNNKASDEGMGGITYFRGKVMSKSLTNGTGPNNVARRVFNVGINSDQVEIDPT